MRIPGAPDDRSSRSGVCFNFGSALGGAASGVGSVVGAGIEAGSANSAANEEAKQAAADAANLGVAGAGAQSFLNNYVAGGAGAYKNELSNPTLTSNAASSGFINQAQGTSTQAQGELQQQDQILTGLGNGTGITQQTIQDLPGYAAINALGQEGVQNSAAARGLANSGAALKGAADYATAQAQNGYQALYSDQLGAANALGSAAGNLNNEGNSYLNQSNAYQNALTSEFGRSNAESQIGLTASQTSAQNELTAAGASNSAAYTGANALAAGTVGSGNAIGNGLASGGNAYAQYSLYNSLLNGGSTPYGSNTYGNNGVYYGQSYNSGTSPQVSGIYNS